MANICTTFERIMISWIKRWDSIYDGTQCEHLVRTSYTIQFKIKGHSGEEQPNPYVNIDVTAYFVEYYIVKIDIPDGV